MWRVVDVSETDRCLTLSRNHLVVSADGAELGRVPLADIQSVIVHGYGAMISLNLIDALAAAGIPLVSCATNHMPTAISLPVVGNFEQAVRQRAQADAQRGLSRGLWRLLIRAKIQAQAAMLARIDHPDAAALHKLAAKVKSGDPDNVEGQAARYYWARAMGPDFRRDQDGGGLNPALNYGYTILRSAVARAVVAAGLCPSLGVHHRHRLNGFQLVDDVIEPFRPLIDFRVRSRASDLIDGLDRDGKAWLTDVVNARMMTSDGETALSNVLAKTALSLAEAFVSGTKSIDLPSRFTEMSQESLTFDGTA